MATSIVRGLPVAAAFAGLLFASTARAQATAPPSPFSKVPTLSTACYSDKDPFASKLDAASESVNRELERQRTVNAKIEEDYRNLDAMAMAQRMQEWMMSNPQEAAKYMQATQAMGQDAQTEVPEVAAAAEKFRTDREQLVARYKTTRNEAEAPAWARLEALQKKLVAANGCGIGDGECSVPDWAWPEYEAILRAVDSANAAHCAEWWNAKGPMHGHLNGFRDWLAGTYVPYWKSHEDIKLTQFAIMNTPAASWRSTVAHEKAIEYMGVVQQLFQLRAGSPRCTPAACNR